MICLPCGLAADLLTLSRFTVDERQIGITDDWLAPVAALVIHLHDKGCAGSTRCDCQHKIGVTSIPGEPFIRGAHESDNPVAAFMGACLADDRLRPFDLLFTTRAVNGTPVHVR